MPCGGIEPIKPSPEIENNYQTKVDPTKGGCWVCGYGGCHHFCHEWDTYIHARCVPKFLQTEEGLCLIEHKHTIFLDFSLEEDKSGPYMETMDFLNTLSPIELQLIIKQLEEKEDA